MTDSAIAFGSAKAVIATDLTGIVHTPKVTTDDATDAILIPGFGMGAVKIGTVSAGAEPNKVHTICVTTDSANAGIALNGAAGQKIVLGVDYNETTGVAVLAVTTDAPNSAILINGFGSDYVKIATVLSGGVHTLAVNDTADAAFAVWSFGANKSVIASVAAAGVHSLTLSGLVPPVDPDAAAYIARAGITTPAYVAAIEALVPALKSAGLWSKLEWLNLYCATDDIAGAAKNATKADFDTTFVNSPTFGAGHGVTFAGNKYGLVDFDPAIDATVMSLNSACIFAWAESNTATPPATSGTVVGGALSSPQQTFRLRPGDGAGNTYFDVNNLNTGVAGVYTPPAYSGLWIANRTASNSVKQWRNGSNVASSSASSTGMGGTKMTAGAERFDNGFTDEFFTGQVSIVGAGAGLTDTDIASLYAAFADLRTAVGL